MMTTMKDGPDEAKLIEQARAFYIHRRNGQPPIIPDHGEIVTLDGECFVQLGNVRGAFIAYKIVNGELIPATNNEVSRVLAAQPPA
jgi:hypothetical protein